MKQLFISPFARAGILASMLFLAGCATTQTRDVPGTLNVHVSVPPSWNMLWDDRISDAFVDEVREVFHWNGFDRPVENVRYIEDPANVPYLLTVNLTEWRINRIGNVDCTFTANLRTPTGEKHLGVYTNTEMRWLQGAWRDRFSLARSFEDAAEGAIRELFKDVARSEMLPGFPRNVG